MSGFSLFRRRSTASPAGRPVRPRPSSSSSCPAGFCPRTRDEDGDDAFGVCSTAAWFNVARWLLALTVCLAGFSRPANAQFAPGTELNTRSLSGQFVVAGNRQPSRLPAALASLPLTNWVRLEPQLLALSCERVKTALLRSLNAPDRWRGRVFLSLHPVRGADDPILITSERFADGWAYRLDLPDFVEAPRLVRALVRVLLTEWANRNSAGGAADVPAWLGEGLPEELLSDPTRDLVVRPPQAQGSGPPMRLLTRQGRWPHPLAAAHAFLLTHPPLTLEALSWPPPGQFVGEAALTYRYSAQLFVHELLRLRDGRAALGAMLEALPRHLNWQTAFFQAFRAYFQRPLDLEKWWDLQVVDFTSHELSQAWNRADSLRQLDEILRAFVQVRASTNAPAAPAAVPLQAVLLADDYASQSDLWRFKVQQLQLLRVGAVPEVVLLADEYRRTLETYLRRMERGRSVPGDALNRYEQSRIARETARQLNLLDLKREALRPTPRTAPPATPALGRGRRTPQQR